MTFLVPPLPPDTFEINLSPALYKSMQLKLYLEAFQALIQAATFNDLTSL